MKLPFRPQSSLDLDSRVQRLEADKDNLQLQVVVLQEQIEAQQEKIVDLERALEQKRAQLTHTEEVLQKVLLLAKLFCLRPSVLTHW